MMVRCILIATIVILQLSNTIKCSDKVENGDEKQAFFKFYENYQSFPRSFTDYFRNDLKTRSFSDESKLKENDADTKQQIFKRGCGNSLCEFFKSHRVIRQAGYSPMYPQLPTSYPHRQPNNTNQYNTHQPNNPYGNNLYPSYSKPVVPIIPYQMPVTNRPVYNSSIPHYLNNNISNHNYQNSRHTYPPSPRPLNSQPWPNYRANTTSMRLPTNNSYPFGNQPKNSFGNVPTPGYPNSYPRSNVTNYNIYNRTQGGNRIPNTYPQPRPLPSGHMINNSRPNYNGFNTYPTTNYNKNFNGYQSPNSSHYNSNGNYYNPQTNYSYGTPIIPNYRNNAGSNSHGSNNFHVPSGGTNSYPTNNNFNQSLNNPYQWTTNRPQTPYNPNIPQYNAAMEPNHFYYVPNNNGSQYDPRRHPSERFSY